MTTKTSRPKKKTTKKKKTVSLRKRAEGLLAKQKERLRELSATDLKKLAHELGTHQIELEIQNEELRTAQVELELSRTRYADLYDFAPMGYFTFDKNGLIKEVNLIGAEMLGVSKRLLLNKPMLSFIETAHRTIFRNHLQDVFAAPAVTSCEISLLKKDGAMFNAQLNSLSFSTGRGEPDVCRTAISDVTSRTKTEKALQESEIRYHSLFDNMMDGFAYCRMIFDDRGRPMDFVYLDVNSSFERLTGLKNVVGKKASTVIPGIREAHPELLEIYGRVAATGRTEKFEIEFKPLQMWLSISVYSTKRDHFTAIIDNITERKRAGVELRAAHDDLERRVDEQTAEIRGANESLEQRIIERSAELRAANENLRAQRVAALNIMDDAVAARRKADEASAGLRIEVAERKRAEEALQASEARYRLLFENMIDGFALHKIVVDDNGKPIDYVFLQANTAFERLTGLKVSTIIGKQVTEVLPGIENDPADWIGTYGRIALTGNDIEFEQYAEPLGKWFAVSAFSPMKDHFATIFVDITERKRAEIALKQAHTELESRAYELAAVNRELESFSYTVSHDLKAPLRIIEGFTKAVLEDCSEKLDATGKDYLMRVHSAGQRMTQLIDAMLDMARLTRGQLQERAVDLSSLAQIITHEIRKEAPERRVEFIIPKKIKVKGDQEMLHVMLENLFHNAWKFTGKHETAKIEFGTANMDGKAVYFVRDDGAGFDMQYADKLFQPFKRLHTEAEFRGLGIGLAIANRIILRHGGRMWAESAPEKGATFFFTLE